MVEDSDSGAEMTAVLGTGAGWGVGSGAGTTASFATGAGAGVGADTGSGVA